MIEKACTKCKIYFPSANGLYSCPNCYTPLENIKDSSGYTPKDWNPVTNEVIDKNANNSGKKKIKPTVSDKTRQSGNCSDTMPIVNSAPATTSKKYHTGVIDSYNPRDVGHQNFFERASLFFRGMHHGNTRYDITFIDDDDNQTYTVYYYGEYSALSSAIPYQGARITVEGSPNGNIFETENVYIGEGLGQKIKMRNQNPTGHRTNPLPALIVIVVLVGLFFLVKTIMSGGFDYLGSIIQTLLISTAIIFFLGLIFLSRRMQFRTLCIGSLVLGGIVTALICSNGGVADDIQVIVASVLVLGAMIAGLVVLIRGSFR